MALEFLGPGKGILPRVSTLIGPKTARYAAVRPQGYPNSAAMKANLAGLAFYHDRSFPYNAGYFAPARWSAPGNLLKRPPCAMVMQAKPSSGFANTRGNVLDPGTAVLIDGRVNTAGLGNVDIPGKIPAEFMLNIFDNTTSPWNYQAPGGGLPNAFNDGNLFLTPAPPRPFRPDLFTYVRSTIQMNTAYSVPLPHPWAGPRSLFDPDTIGLPIATADFLLIHVGSVFNAWNRFNTEDLIAHRKKFPQYAVRFYRPTPGDVTDGASFSLAQTGTQFPSFTQPSYQQALEFAAGWRAATEDACSALQAAGIDAQIVGEESAATRANVGKLISDYFGFVRPRVG